MPPQVDRDDDEDEAPARVKRSTLTMPTRTVGPFRVRIKCRLTGEVWEFERKEKGR